MTAGKLSPDNIVDTKISAIINGSRSISEISKKES